MSDPNTTDCPFCQHPRIACICAEGMDSKGRLAGGAAIDRLMASVPEGPEWNKGRPVNPWDTADDAVEQADDETVRAALRQLFALHLFNLEASEPVVAARNVEKRDLLRFDGVPYRVVDDPDHRGQMIYIRARRDHQEDAEPRTFINGANVRLTLIERPAPNPAK